MLTWRKLTSAKWEDAWMERLQCVGPTRLAVVRLPSRKSLRIEAYALTRKEADALARQFGGQIREIKDKPISEPVARKPLPIRDRLWIADSPETARRLGDSRPVLVIPAAMAFGTGDHATTASCLRLLCDVAQAQGGPWDFLDLGTGSGILAIAARKLGARKAEGCDFDPHAVRTAKENVALNAAGPIPVRKLDVLQWAPPRTWDVVAANLFSQVLIQASPAIAAAVRPGGALILSGILLIQEKEVAAAFRKLGFAFQKVVRKGKWASLLAEKTGTPRIAQ
ncbi:MAG: 50S ribosomal protein L11 methyltransferase [Verrucomicrobiota bacterium]